MNRHAPGDRVRARTVDPAGHTRLPRYVRGATGVVVEVAGEHPLADARARGENPPAEPVYHVRFAAQDLFGAGEHAVVVELWHAHLEDQHLGNENREDDRER